MIASNKKRIIFSYYLAITMEYRICFACIRCAAPSRILLLQWNAEKWTLTVMLNVQNKHLKSSRSNGRQADNLELRICIIQEWKRNFNAIELYWKVFIIIGMVVTLPSFINNSNTANMAQIKVNDRKEQTVGCPMTIERQQPQHQQQQSQRKEE